MTSEQQVVLSVFLLIQSAATKCWQRDRDAGNSEGAEFYERVRTLSDAALETARRGEVPLFSDFPESG